MKDQSRIAMSETVREGGAAAGAAASAATRPLWIGVDVGGTNIKWGLVDDGGRVWLRDHLPTQADRPPQLAIERVVAAIDARLATANLRRADIRGLGLATPGTMDIPGGMILEPPNLPAWRHFPIRDALGSASGLPVTFANDASAAAFGEHWAGTGGAGDNLLLLTLGTGVGGGVLVNGRTLDGAHSYGGECGHIIIDPAPSARMCGCGRSGHLEAYASATALVKRCEEALASGRASRLRAEGASATGASASGASATGALATGASTGITALAIAQAAAAGDSLARELVLETALYLGIGLATLIHVLDPAVVLLGGAMDFGGESSALGREFLEKIRREVGLRVFPELAGKTTIRFASLGGDAGFIGAAGIARAAALASGSPASAVRG
jgi:glucokinase